MKVTEAEKKRVHKEVSPKEIKVIEWKGGIREEWVASEIYKDQNTYNYKCTYRSNWGRGFTLEGANQ